MVTVEVEKNKVLLQNLLVFWLEVDEAKEVVDMLFLIFLWLCALHAIVSHFIGYTR